MALSAALLIVMGVIGNHEAPKAHVWVMVIFGQIAVQSTVMRRRQRR